METPIQKNMIFNNNNNNNHPLDSFIYLFIGIHLFGCVYGLSFVFIQEKFNVFNDKNLYFFPF